MRKVVGVFLLLTVLLVPQSVYAMDIDLHFAKFEEQWVSEFWYDHSLIWQIALSPDGADVVSTNQARYQTVITPDFAEGCFLLRIY